MWLALKYNKGPSDTALTIRIRRRLYTRYRIDKFPEQAFAGGVRNIQVRSLQGLKTQERKQTERQTDIETHRDRDIQTGRQI